MPGPYKFTFNETLSITYTDRNGDEQTISKKTGQTHKIDDPCDAFRFVLAAIDEGIPYHGERGGAIWQIQLDCMGKTIETMLQESKVTPLEEITKKQIKVTSDETPPGKVDNRPLSQQFFDKSKPISDNDLISNLSLQGVLDDELNNEFTKIIHNESPKELPHPEFGLDKTEKPKKEVDPVDVFQGQYVLSVSDVDIPSRGFPLQLNRIYRSGTVYFGPFGYNWDHNYNVYLRKLVDGSVAIWTGQLNEHVFRIQPDDSYEPPTGVFMRLEYHLATITDPEYYILIDIDGLKQIFALPDGWPKDDRIPLVIIEDRYGNAHQLSYDAQGRLIRVTDHADRYIEFHYDNRDLINQIHDHTERIWKFFYDPEIEHLIAARTPTTLEYPKGLTTRYEYDRYHKHPALIHNLIRMTDPAGQVVVENYYGNDPSIEDFGRVVRQYFGGFEATLHAEWIQYVPHNREAINVPALKVEVVDPGILKTYIFNYRGDLLEERFRLVRDGSYRLVSYRYRYDKQGNLIESYDPNGLGVIYRYDHENTDPRARGNLLKIELTSPPSKPAPSREIARFTYESRFHQVKTIRDEAQAIITFIYDYEETTNNRGDVIRIIHPNATLPDGNLQESHESFHYNNFGQVIKHIGGEGNIYGYEYYDEGCSSGYIKRTVAGEGEENQSQDFEYDQFGNLNKVIYASGAFTQFIYNELGQMIKIRQPVINGLFGEIVNHYGPDGRLMSQETPRGNYQDNEIKDAFIVHKFEFDVLGYLHSIVYGANTEFPRKWQVKRNGEGFPIEIIDPLDRITLEEYDERNLIIQQKLFANTNEERTFRSIYDINGNLIREISPIGYEIEYKYDSWDRLKETVLPGEENKRTRVINNYGVRDQINTIETFGICNALEDVNLISKLEYEYDERGRLVRRIQGQLDNKYYYDKDTSLNKVVNQKGNIFYFNTDALGRLRAAIDPIGNRIIFNYDSNGNLRIIEEQEFDPLADDYKQYRTTMDYDVRNRLKNTTDSLNNSTSIDYDDRDFMISCTNLLGITNEYDYDLEGMLISVKGFTGNPPHQIIHKWIRDLIGRTVAYIDPEGKVTQYKYNSEDQWKQIILSDGSVRERKFNSSGQLEKEIAPSGTSTNFKFNAYGMIRELSFNEVTGVAAVSKIKYKYDGLGRPLKVSQSPHQIDLEYDQQDRLISESLDGIKVTNVYDDIAGYSDLIYPDGRIDRYKYDALGRISEILLHEISPDPLTGNLLPSGKTLAKYEYVGQNRLRNRILGNESLTNFGYDQGRRLTSIKHVDSNNNLISYLQYVYDAASRRRVFRCDPISKFSSFYEFDNLSRLNKVFEDITAPEVQFEDMNQDEQNIYINSFGAKPSNKTFEFILNDADARLEKSKKDNGYTSTAIYSLNDLYQIEQISYITNDINEFTYDLDGRRTKDDRFKYIYDSLGRLVEIKDIVDSNLLLRLEYDPLGRVMLKSKIIIQN